MARPLPPEKRRREAPDAGEGSGTVHFVLGALIGAGIGFGTSLTVDVGKGGMFAIILGTALVAGVLSWRYGDHFWTSIIRWFPWS